MPRFRKVRPGSPLRINAEDHNAWQDAARAARRGTGVGQQLTKSIRVVRVKNSSGVNLSRYGVLAVDRTAISRDENEDEFKGAYPLEGFIPGAVTHTAILIALEPIPDGEVGRAAAEGVIPCYLNIADEDHLWADIDDGQTATLLTAARGPAKILWKEPEGERLSPTAAWAVVQIGLWNKHGDLFAVTVEIDGGLPGSVSTTCTFTYTVRAQDGTIIGEDMTPEVRRFPETIYTEPEGEQPGTAYYGPDGTLQLFDANELPEIEECETLEAEALIIDGGVPDAAYFPGGV